MRTPDSFSKVSIVNITLLVGLLLAACDLCPSDPCSEDNPCAWPHACAHGQCVLPCETIADCPAGSGRCMDPMEDAFLMCVDPDGVPGQMCVSGP